MGPVGLQRLLNETQDGGVGFFRQAALKLGRDAAKWVGQALGWNGSDYADRLFEALDEGNYELVDVCAQIAPLDALEKRGNTALHIAVKNGDRRMIELLLRHGAPLHALNIDGFSPLTMAEKQGNDELVSFMNLQCQAAAMAPVLQPLLDQIEKLRKEIETLKKPTGITPLTTPGGSTPTGPTGRTLPAIAGTMLPSPAASASTPGASAASSAQVGKKKSGKQPAASPPTTTRELPLSVPGREQALIKAAKSGDLDYVRQLVAAGTSVNAKNLEDETPLIVASTRGKDAVVEFLISNNADLDAERKEQSRQIDPFSPKDTEKYGLTIEMARTAVEIAAECGHKAIVRKLVAAGAQLTRQYSMWNEQGQRVTSTYSAALIGATRKGYTDLADLFIEKGVQLAVSFQKRSGNAITLADYILFSAIEDKKGTVVQWILPFYEKLKFDRIYSETRDSQTQQVTTITIGQEAMVLAVDHDALDILGFLVEKEVVNLNQSFRSAYSSQDRYSRTTTVVPEQTFGQYLEEKASNEYKSEIYKFLTSKGIESQF
jgi:ankyrin repeat protein